MVEITKKMAETGISVDKLAKIITTTPQFENLEQQDVVNEIVDFTVTYPSRKALNSYFSKRAKQQKPKRIVSKPDSPFIKDDNSCLVRSLQKELTNKEIIEEMKDLKQNPNAYFGKLLITHSCKKDLFFQPVAEQKRIASEVIKELSPKKKRVKKEPTFQNRLRKVVLWGVGFLAFRKIF